MSCSPVLSRLSLFAFAGWLAIVPAACNSHRLAAPDPAMTSAQKERFGLWRVPKLDLLFMVDDSPSMAPLQAKLSAQLGSFIDALANPTTGGLPDLHVAVVSSSLGGGAWGNVNQCASGAYPGDDGGKFQQGPGGAGHGSCTMLHPGQTFLATGGGSTGAPPNYDGDVRDAFQCMALLGDGGCGFESPFASVYYALSKATQPNDPDNAGFLRDDAALAVVMVTNEDDCSVAAGSLLLDPGINSVSDPTGLGALQSYRCNEFGHLCNSAPPPHDAPASPVTLDGCVSAEDAGKTDPAVRAPDGSSDPTMGHLWPTVAQFTEFLISLKNNPDDVLVAALAGPTSDDGGHSLYRVLAQANPAANGELDPVVDHSCTHATSDADMPEYADPAVRIRQWVDGFGANGVFYPICADDFRAAMLGIARAITRIIDPACVSGDIAWVDAAEPSRGHDCQVSVPDASGAGARMTLPECLPLAADSAPPTPTNAPCYRLIPNASWCAFTGAATSVSICTDASCNAAKNDSGWADVQITCALQSH